MSNTRYFEFWQRANKYVEHRGVACDLSAIHQESWHKKFLLENVWMVTNLKTCEEFRGQENFKVSLIFYATKLIKFDTLPRICS